MRIDLTRHHDFAAALVRLEGAESFVSEASALVHVDDNIDVAVQRQHFHRPVPPDKGLFAQVRRIFGAGGMLVSSYRITDGERGSVFLSPRDAATIRLVSLVRDQAWLLRQSAFLGASGDTRLEFDPERAPPLADVPCLLRAVGPGTIALWSENEIVPIQVRDRFTLPTREWIGMDECLAAAVSAASAAPADRSEQSPMHLHLTGVGQLFANPRSRLAGAAAPTSPQSASISTTRDR